MGLDLVGRIGLVLAANQETVNMKANRVDVVSAPPADAVLTDGDPKDGGGNVVVGCEGKTAGSPIVADAIENALAMKIVPLDFVDLAMAGGHWCVGWPGFGKPSAAGMPSVTGRVSMSS
ncbi:MAG: hypothetical protein NTV86_04375 [Planctomycetota bacterium]|nr:hypothetical protein [Planctomycetota bacterium]